jgi:periplasmic divalent cation tolerance protein
MAVLVLTTVPDVERGETIARALVDERLAACVNVGPPMFSFYRWQGATQRDSEHQLVIKTVREKVAALQERIAELHPYELPEFLVVAVDDGGADYLAWIKAETGGPGIG